MNSKSILEKLPDYGDFISLTEEIAKTSSRKLYLENKVKSLESTTVLRVMKEQEFFQGGKPPSMSFVESTYKYTGIGNEILPFREELAEATAKLDSLKIRMDVYKQLVEIWRTLSANERSSSLQ